MQTHSERLAYLKRYRAANPPTDEKRAKAAEYQRSYRLKTKYGLTIEQRDGLLSSQEGRCALPHCRARVSFDGKWRTREGAHVDHCHKTGRVRGILCTNCNQALGKLGDSLEALQAVVEYLR